jgi:hypothetical protein
MPVAISGTTKDIEKGATTPATDLIDCVNTILGYDLQETQEIRNDTDLYGRIMTRLGTAGKTIPVDRILDDSAE